MDDPKNQLPMTTSSKGPVSSSRLSPENPNWVAAVTATLARLALHYWRPDFTDKQAALLISDYIRDLEGYSVIQVERACMVFRKGPENKFFPRSGELLAILNPPKAEWDLPPRRLPAFTGYKSPERPASMSVGDVLRKFDSFHAATAWETWKENRLKS